MVILFMLCALYCLYLAIRRFSGKRAPYYIEKDPDITDEQKAVWSRFNGYSMLFWAGFALLFATEIFLDAWPFFIPMGICAAGGVFMSLRASNELRKEPKQGFHQPKGSSGKKNKKKKK